MYCENGKWIMDDSAITRREIVDMEAKSSNEETKTVPTNFNKKTL